MVSPRISVCVPVYNGGPYLEACLSGIAAQTFADFEVLVVDDGSSDGGLEIARRWQSADSRFRVIVNEKNLGLVGNWNRCIELAKGEWIKFLFHDDLIEPQCLEELLIAGEAGGGFVACSRQILFEGEIESSLKDWYDKHRQLLARIHGGGHRMSGDDYSRAKLNALEFNIVGEPSSTMIARCLFDRFGRFDPLLIQLCDSEMWNRLGSNVGLDYVTKTLVCFRVHKKSATGTNLNRQYRSWVLDEIVELNRLCRSPDLERFRAVARREGAWSGLQRRLAERMNTAFDKARCAAQEEPPNHEWQKELSAVLGDLPGGGRARWNYGLHRVKRLARLA